MVTLGLKSACEKDFLAAVCILEKTFQVIDINLRFGFHPDYSGVLFSLGLCILIELQHSIRHLATRPTDKTMQQFLLLSVLLVKLCSISYAK